MSQLVDKHGNPFERSPSPWYRNWTWTTLSAWAGGFYALMACGDALWDIAERRVFNGVFEIVQVTPAATKNEFEVLLANNSDELIVITRLDVVAIADGTLTPPEYVHTSRIDLSGKYSTYFDFMDVNRPEKRQIPVAHELKPSETEKLGLKLGVSPLDGFTGSYLLTEITLVTQNGLVSHAVKPPLKIAASLMKDSRSDTGSAPPPPFPLSPDRP